MQINNCVNSTRYIPYEKNRNTKACAKFNLNHVASLNPPVQEGSTNAVSRAEYEDEGEFLGITMIPENGQSVTYGMRAMLSNKSTSSNPIVQVISNLGGKNEIYNVDIRKVDPKNATQLEMFALLSYTDKIGLTDVSPRRDEHIFSVSFCISEHTSAVKLSMPSISNSSSTALFKKSL